MAHGTAAAVTVDGVVGEPSRQVDVDALGDVATSLIETQRTLAVVVTLGGEVVVERYGATPDTPFGPGAPVQPDTPLVSWSMAKSITHALVGLLVGDGLLDPDAPAPIDAWRTTPKERITLQHLLTMTPGLEFVEDYVDAGISHCIEMLFGSGRDDMAAYAAALPLVAEPGTVWNYSSGTTNIISSIIGSVVGGREGVEALATTRLFDPLGMSTARLDFDGSGTFVGSSFVHASARDYARFGRLYLDDGCTPDGHRLLPDGWVDHARRPTATDPESGFGYGAHWWLWPDLPGSLAAHGYEGQYTLVVPDRDLVVVHLGKWTADERLELEGYLRRIVEVVGEPSS